MGYFGAYWLSDVDQLLTLVEVVDSQTDRRVFKGEKVPAQEKIVSLYEPHTDIIVKDRRDVQYGHKLNLTQGKSRMILDLVIETGNPADSDRFIPMLERQIDIYDRAPRQATVDGGYASSAVTVLSTTLISGNDFSYPIMLLEDHGHAFYKAPPHSLAKANSKRQNNLRPTQLSLSKEL